MALARPARYVERAEVAAVAARDSARAERFAARHGIAWVHDGYDELIADPDVDAVYVPLPNGRHAEWAIAALDAGKHVLCEKPLTANAAQAREVAAPAEHADRVLVEAFHWRYHTMARRMVDIVASCELGEVRHVEAAMCIPLPMLRDIRYQLDLAGGAVMDIGCCTPRGSSRGPDQPLSRSVDGVRRRRARGGARHEAPRTARRFRPGGRRPGG
jgi:predicted dehydrogenase